MRAVLMIVLAMIILSGTAFAATVTIEYIEPGQNNDGTPLTDLKEVQLKWKQDAGIEQLITVPATSPAGGKAVIKDMTVADPPVCGKTVISVTAEAVDTSGNHSPKAGPVTAVRDVSQAVACQTPKAPTNLKIVIK